VFKISSFVYGDLTNSFERALGIQDLGKEILSSLSALYSGGDQSHLQLAESLHLLELRPEEKSLVATHLSLPENKIPPNVSLSPHSNAVFLILWYADSGQSFPHFTPSCHLSTALVESFDARYPQAVKKTTFCVLRCAPGHFLWTVVLHSDRDVGLGIGDCY
jgi:hypothetical protein